MHRRFTIFTPKSILIGLAIAAASATVLATGPLVARYCIGQADAAFRQDEMDEALGWLESAERWNGGDADVQLRLARVCRRTEQFDCMREHLTKAREAGGSAKRIQRERWLATAQSGRVHEVEHHLPDLLADAGEDGPEICAAFVTGYSLSLNFRAATSLLDAWAADYPDDAEPDFRRGDLQFSQQRWGRAVKAFDSGLRKEPDRFKPRLRLAQCLLKQNASEEAESHFRQCLALEPDNLEAKVGLADCLISMGELDAAGDLLRVALKRAPHHFEARLRLGRVELAARRPQQALQWLQPLSENWPEDWALAPLMLQTLQMTDNHQAAQRYLEIVQSSDGEIARLERLLELIHREPNDLELRFQIGQMVLRHRSRPEGVAWLRSILRYDPDHTGAHQVLAEYYEKTGDVDLARRHSSIARSTERQEGVR